MRTLISLLALSLLVFGALPPKAFAVDNGQYANVPKETRDWVAALQATGTKAVCCALSDGQIVQDQDWDYGKNAYRVYITAPDNYTFAGGAKGEWVDVPPEAVVNTFPLPRLVAHALVWVTFSYGADGTVTIYNFRCFLAGGGV